MKHITILALEDSALNCIDSSYQIMTRVNDFLRYQGKEPFYEVEIAGGTSFGHGLYHVCSKALTEVAHTDVVIVPITCGQFRTTVEANRKFIPWVAERHRAGAEIVSCCVGSFFLASTGLLDGRQCAIHWASRDEFQAMYPQVLLVSDRLVTDENGIYTCGGAYSYLNLLLYLIDKHLGREMSILAAKMFEIDIDRKSQNPFVIFVGQKGHGDEGVLSAQQYIEQNFTERINVDQVCSLAGAGRRTFERRFKGCTGNTIVEYIQRVKVEAAKKELETGRKTVNEIVYSLGYGDTNTFRALFKRITGLSPVDYRRKYTYSAT